MFLKFAFPFLCAGLVCTGLPLTTPALAAPKPPLSHNATADKTSAVVVVSKLLTLRAKNNFNGMYDLMTSNMKRGMSRKQFLAGTSQSKADIAQMTPALRGQYALFADTHNTLHYRFAVVGPDMTDPSVVLVHAFPKSASAGKPAILKIYTILEPGSGTGASAAPHRTVDGLQSVGRAMMDAKHQPGPPSAAR